MNWGEPVDEIRIDTRGCIQVLVYYFDPRSVSRISDNEQGHRENSKFDDISGECLLFCKRFVQDAGMVTVISVDGDNSVQKWIIGVACVFHLDTYTALNDATLYKV